MTDRLTAKVNEWRVEQCRFDLPEKKTLKSVSEIKSILIRHSHQLDSLRFDSIRTRFGLGLTQIDSLSCVRVWALWQVAAD